MSLSDNRVKCRCFYNNYGVYSGKAIRESVKELKLKILKEFKLSGFGKFDKILEEVFGEKLT